MTDEPNTEIVEEQDKTDVEDKVVITPESGSDDEEAVGGSPVEKMRKALPEQFSRDFIVADDDHPLVQTAGSKSELTANASHTLQKELADTMYQDPDVFFREWKQNHIAAVVREAKRVIRNKHPDGSEACFHTFEHEHPAHEDLYDTSGVEIRLPKSNSEILDIARELGYNPSIEFHINHDEQKFISRDNGISMTSGEVLDVWLEPGESGSGEDLSSAGAKGLGALTWVTVGGFDGAMEVTVRTRRRETADGRSVPERDQRGFKFFSYFGGVVPVPGEPEDGFYGTRFEMAIDEDIDSHALKAKMEKYTDVLPTMITWKETENGVTEEDEFERTDFIDRYDQEPAIVLERPGEFTVVLDTPDVVPKSVSTDHTFLLDNAIERNMQYSQQSVDTLWNDHIQIQNEQGLIVAGPNRGMRKDDVDELYGGISDISDDDKPMPDIPLPEPVTSRDNLANDEAHERFFTYVNEIAKQEELDVVADYGNKLLKCDTKPEALAYMQSRGTEYNLFRSLIRQHYGHRSLTNPRKLLKRFIGDERFDIDKSGAPQIATHNIRDSGNLLDMTDSTDHEKYEVVELIKDLDEEVSYATKDTSGNPDLKENRKTSPLREIIVEKGMGPIYVGYTLNEDRAKVLFNNHQDAVLIKTNRYGPWQKEPWNARLLKHVPMSLEDAEDTAEDWDIPDEVQKKHGRDNTASTTNQSGYTIDDFEDRRLKIRYTKNSAVDGEYSLREISDGLDDADPGDNIFGKRDKLVVFPSTRDKKISDHYDWSQHVAIAKTTKKEAEFLSDHEQVYYPDEFEAYIGSWELWGYHTGDEEVVKLTPEELPDISDPEGQGELKDNYVFVPSNDPLWNILFHHRSDRLGDDYDPDHEHAEKVRDRFFEILKETTGHDITRGKVTLVCLPADGGENNETADKYHRWWHLNAYFTHGNEPKRRPRIYNSVWESPERQVKSRWVSKTLVEKGYRHNNIDVKAFDHRRARGISNELHRAKYPAWDNNSEMWSVLDSHNAHWASKNALRALRDANIDPSDMEPEQVYRLVSEAFETLENQ